jgi:hypothetical protein
MQSKLLIAPLPLNKRLSYDDPSDINNIQVQFDGNR